MKKIKVEVTYPDTLEGMMMLQDRIDTVYSNIIMNNINKLECDLETKKQYITQIHNELDDWKEPSTLDKYLANEEKKSVVQ